MSRPAPPHPRVVVSSVVGCLGGAVVYLLVLLHLGWSPTRTANSLGYASNFFDLQANALLEGHLDVPTGSLGIEGFVIGGRTYMYFPPFPALLRLPVMLVTHEFDGRLTLASMALAWLVFAVMTSRLLWLVRRELVGDLPPGRREAALAAVVLTACTAGTVLTFDASLPWVYHEVYVWSVATVVGGLYWLVRASRQPDRRSLGWLGAFALAAVLTRTTGGFALCGAIALAAVLWWLVEGRRRTAGHTVAVGFLAVAVVPVAASVALNLAKFDHPYLFPLDQQVWTQVNEHRREALAANGGHITGPQFAPTTGRAYLRADGLRFTPWFPWVSLPAQAPPLVDGGTVLDQTYRTASVPATTPLLTLLAIGALPSLLLGARPGARRVLGPALLGAAVIPAGILMYGYVANRYTSEFVPVLVIGSAITTWAVAPRLLRATRLRAGAALAAVALLTAWSVAVQGVTGLWTSAVTGRGEDLVSLLRTQQAVDSALGVTGPPVLRDVTELPADAAPDTLATGPGCSALYLATGDRYEPWVLVEAAPTVLRVTLHRGVRAGRVALARYEGSSTREVVLETRTDHHVRVVVEDGDEVTAGPWYGVYPETSTTVGIAVDAHYSLVEVTTTPGGRVDVFPAQRIDEHWVIHPGRVVLLPGREARAEALGLTLDPGPARAATLCHDVVAAGDRR